MASIGHVAVGLAARRWYERLVEKPNHRHSIWRICLSHCRWSHRKYASATVAQIARGLERLMSANEALRAHADGLRRQAN